MWNRPKEVEQPQGGGEGREKEEAGHVATLPRREVVTIRARPGAGSSPGADTRWSGHRAAAAGRTSAASPRAFRARGGDGGLFERLPTNLAFFVLSGYAQYLKVS